MNTSRLIAVVMVLINSGCGLASWPEQSRTSSEANRSNWNGWDPTREKTLQVNPRFNGLVSGEDLVRREGEFRQVVAGMTRTQALARLGAPLVSDAKHARWSAANPATGMTVVFDLMLDASGVIRYAAVTKPVSSLAEAVSTSNSGPVLRADLDPRFDGMGWTGKSPRDNPTFPERPNVPFPELLSNSQ